MGRIRAWLDDRSGYRRLASAALDEPVRGGARWAYVFGSALAIMFVLQALTGVVLALYYSPSTSQAWGSVYYINEVLELGWLVRGLHHWGSSAIVVLLVLHLLQVFVFGADRAPRELNWWIGVILLFVTLAFAVTGYLLPWDQKGYWATSVVTNIAGTLPAGGHWLQEVLQGGNDLGNLTLTRFFGFHVFFLPAALVLFLVAHIYLFRRHGVTPRWWASKEELDAETEPFWPRQATYDLLFAGLVIAVIFALALGLDGAPLEAPADPSSSYVARPDWYFRWLFELLKLVPGEVEGFALLGFLLIGFVFLAALPVVDRTRGRRVRDRWPHYVVAGLLIFVVAGLTARSLIADYTDPAYLEKRQEAEAAAARAKRLAAAGIPPGGASQLYLNDPIAHGRHLFARHCQSCHRAEGDKGGASAPDLRGYMTLDWVRQVIADPGQAKFFGNTAVTGMPPTRATPDELDALATYVLSLGGRAEPPPGAAELFERMGCHACHALADEPPRAGPTLAGYGSPAWVIGAIEAPAAPSYYGPPSTMPAFEGTLGTSELEAVTAFILRDAEGSKQAMNKTTTGLLGAAAILAGLVATTPIEANSEATGKKLYDPYCASCHGVDGKGDTPAGKQLGVQDWTTSKVLEKMSDAEIAKTIREGVKKDGTQRMPPYDSFSDNQVKSLVRYVRGFQPE